MESTNYKITDQSLVTLSIEVLRFYFDNAKSRLNDFHQQAKETTERGYKLIAIYVTLLTLEIGYLYANWGINTECFTTLAMLIGTAIATFCILKVILPRLYMPLGRSIEEMQPNEYAKSFGNETTKEMQLKCIIRDELIMMEQSITWQKRVNNKRTLLFTLSLISIICGIIASAIVFLITL